MLTITVAGLKGGTGKTTTAAHLLAALAERGRAVGIDADRQGSLLSWAEFAGQGFPWVVAQSSPRLDQQLRGIAGGADYVVVDTPNDPTRDQDVLRGSLRAADVVLVPIAPSPVEFLRLKPLLELLAEIRNGAGSPAAAALLSRVRVVTRSSNEAPEVLQDYQEQGLELLEARVPLREHIAQSIGELKPAPEYLAVAEEIVDRYDTSS